MSGAASIATQATEPRRLHIAWLPSIGALPARDAAAYLGVCYNTLWRRSNLPKKDPRRIRKTAYGTYPVQELDRHLQAEMERE